VCSICPSPSPSGPWGSSATFFALARRGWSRATSTSFLDSRRCWPGSSSARRSPRRRWRASSFPPSGSGSPSARRLRLERPGAFGYGVAMNSRWDDSAVGNLDGLGLLVYASRLIGAETSLVVWGGGNTSIKLMERDYRGREVRVLRVKGSGSDLKSIEKRHFPGVRMDDVLALLDRQDMGDQEMVD